MPGLTNAVLRAPGLSTVVKAAGGIAKERSFPEYASPTFRKWFGQRQARGGGVSG